MKTHPTHSPLLDRLTLEFSLKPFYRPAAGSMRDTAVELMQVWRDLATEAAGLAALLWIGDGSEVLEWKGDLDEPIKWAHTIGFNNLDYGLYPGPQFYATQRAAPFRPGVPVVTYREVARIVAALRSAARDELGKDLAVGATIDPGPEFVQNPWKYETHRELILGGPDSEHPESVAFLSVGERMRADETAYAGYPDGVPDGTPFGEFLGRQFQSFAGALGFDYLWLSNGMGCSHMAWSYLGRVFDGEAFHADRAAESRRSILSFWETFRRECPDMPVELRGTNFGVGMDVASDAVPLREIVREFGAAMPPNTPWGCRRLGAEMAIYLSRLAGARDVDVPARFYLQDPWFNADPWWSYYGREPFDAYCQAACSRLSAAGEIENPTRLEILTIDDELGGLQPEAAREVTPHLLRAYSLRPDAAGPVVWVYPFEDYHDLPEERPELLDHPFFHDWFAVACMTSGLPVATVVEARDFAARDNWNALRDSVLFAPVPLEGWGWTNAVCDWVAGGGRALLYGPVGAASPRVRDLLGLHASDPLDGEFAVRLFVEADKVGETGERRLQHSAVISAGGIAATADPDSGARVVATVEGAGGGRTYAVVREAPEWNGGKVAWLRGSLAFAGRRTLEPRPQDARTRHEPGEWARALLGELGLSIRQERPDPAILPAMLFVARHRGGFILNGHKPDAPVTVHLSFPDGAPLVTERETFVRGDTSSYCFDKTIHHEVRAFVRQPGESYVRVKEEKTPTSTHRCLTITGLQNADVTLYPYPESLADGSLSIILTGRYDAQGEPTPAEPDGPLVPRAVPFEVDGRRGAAVLRNVSETITVNW